MRIFTQDKEVIKALVDDMKKLGFKKSTTFFVDLESLDSEYVFELFYGQPCEAVFDFGVDYTSLFLSKRAKELKSTVCLHINKQNYHLVLFFIKKQKSFIDKLKPGDLVYSLPFRYEEDRRLLKVRRLHIQEDAVSYYNKSRDGYISTIIFPELELVLKYIIKQNVFLHKKYI